MINNLIQDMQKVCPCKVTRCSKFDSQVKHECLRIVIATLFVSELCSISKELQLSIEKIKKTEEQFRWECYVHKMIGDTLYIVGADRRGTVLEYTTYADRWEYRHGIFGQMCRYEKAFLNSINYEKVDWPDVQYRGIF